MEPYHHPLSAPIYNRAVKSSAIPLFSSKITHKRIMNSIVAVKFYFCIQFGNYFIKIFAVHESTYCRPLFAAKIWFQKSLCGPFHTVFMESSHKGHDGTDGNGSRTENGTNFYEFENICDMENGSTEYGNAILSWF